MLCEATFDHFSKELPEMPMLILFTIINMFGFSHIHFAAETGNSFVGHQLRLMDFSF